MNHFSLNLQPPQHSFWHSATMEHHQPHHHTNHHKSSMPLFYHKYDEGGGGGGGGDSDNSSSNANADRSESASTTTNSSTILEKDHMFEKPLTPSDVGKLNRLVIPKQHAEKYFPLAGLTAAAAGDADTASPASGGVLLGFEDESGKLWRFRYSYWNSSQSYVLTKGWSRYVKEKKLDAGDVVYFERHRFDPDRFFIQWRKRGSGSGSGRVNPVGWSAAHQQRCSTSSYNYNDSTTHNNNNNNNYNYGYNYDNNQNVVQASQLYAASHRIPAFAYPPESLHAGTEVRQKARKSGGNSKRVRLFGVNLECQLDQDDLDHHVDDESQTSDGSSWSSQGQAGSGSGSGPTAYNYFDYMGYPPTNHHNHMDINYPHDVNQMRTRLG